MKIFSFIVILSFAFFSFEKNAFSQNKIFNDVGENRIYPKERVERRVYDSSEPNIVVWHTEAQTPDYPGGSFSRTIGFVEAASNEKKILSINGFLVQRQHISGVEKGFLLQFRTSLTYFSLPRRVLGKETKYQNRYDFSELLSEHPKDGIKEGLIKIDYRNIRLIENGKIYHPKKRAVEELNAYGGLKDVPPSLVDIDKADVIPKKYIDKEDTIYLDEVLYFDIDHLPLNFKIEIPSAFINGFEVPFPTFYFEPYNTVTNEWINDKNF